MDDRYPTFRYDELDDTRHDFRLLRLYGSGGNHTSNIECELFHAGFDDRHYEALSYTWGDSDLVETITVNSKTLRITDNLYAALQHLRRADHERILWIDAICIDQAEGKPNVPCAQDMLEEEIHPPQRTEKDAQVQKMGEIYARAETVLVWLGKATVDVDFLMNELERFESQMLPTTSPSREDFIQSLNTQSGRAIEKMTNGMRFLLSRSWFNRMWTLQEIANARSARICSGGTSISATVFSLAAEMLELPIHPHCRFRLDLMPSAAIIDSSRFERSDLAGLMYRFGSCEATDQRDKIYALLGMSSDPLDRETIEPKYRLDLSKVVEQTMHYLLDTKSCPTDQALDILLPFSEVTTICLVPYTSENYDIVETHGLTKRTALTRIFNARTTHGRRPLLRIEPRSHRQKSGSTCYDELLDLSQGHERRSIINSRRNAAEPHVLQWGSSEEHVRVLLISDVFAALQKFDSEGYDGLIRWVMDIAGGLTAGVDFHTRFLPTAVGLGRISYLQLYLDKTMDIDYCSSTGENALQKATVVGREDVVELLIKHHANVNARNALGQTALHLAAYAGKDRIVGRLLDAGAAVDLRGPDGTALQEAAGQSSMAPMRRDAALESMAARERAISMLINAGADVNATPGSKGTALQAASYNGQVRIVEMLIEAGAVVNAPGPEHLGTALTVARRRGHKGVEEMLLRHGAQEEEPRAPREHATSDDKKTGS